MFVSAWVNGVPVSRDYVLCWPLLSALAGVGAAISR